MYRILLIVGLVLAALVYLVPVFVTNLPQFWKNYLPSQGFHLGLDLQGGTHLVMSVDVQKAIENSIDHTIEELKHELADAKVAFDSIERRDTHIAVHFAGSENRDKFTDLVKERFPNLTIESSTTEGGGLALQLALA